MKKVLVTGGAGFIGSNYVHYHHGVHPEDQIFVLDKLTYAANLPNIQDLIDKNAITFTKGDIADLTFLKEFFQQGFDLVINFAAETHVDRSITNPGIFVQTNIVGTHNLLHVSMESGVKRYHQVSTDEVYGDLGDGSTDFFTENTHLAPNCPYAAAKAAADLLVRSYFETYRFPITISRCSNNYGPYQFPEKLIPFFFKLASEGKSLPVYGDGKNVRDWLYVEDHCRAINMIAQSDLHGQVFNIGGNNEKQNIEIARMILKFLGKNENLIKYVVDRQAHDRRYAIDARKIKQELGFEPTVDFESGIKRTFEWYLNNQDWVEATKERIQIKDPKTNSQA